ncbi:MAG: LysE family transporter [Clostridia bacterium]|nr:LysE family transporter [Clostridia bacterium]
MFKYFIQGFLLGIAYVAPIGMQNLYVINTALTKSRFRAYQVAWITTFFDISLALACFLGMGLLMEKVQMLKLVILFLGSIAVIWIGVGLIRSTPKLEQDIDVNQPLKQVMVSCLLVTWANPQALIDGSLLLGGFRASLPTGASSFFILGVCIASFSWFTGISTIVNLFKQSFNEKVIKVINIVCGGIIIYYGLKLGYTFIKAIA